jgi:hypothetical protein
MARRTPIYVESRIRASMDALWDATQRPEQHRRWDFRFGQIEYLPRVDEEPQRFTYATTVAPGVTIAGSGERCRLLAVRPHRRRHPVPDALRLPAALGGRR